MEQYTVNTRSTLKITVMIGLVLILSACAGANTVVTTPDVEGHVAGFWQGLWNGMTIPFAWVFSLFTSQIQIYDVHNDGGWYNFGFVLGTGCLLGGGSAASSR